MCRACDSEPERSDQPENAGEPPKPGDRTRRHFLMGAAAAASTGLAGLPLPSANAQSGSRPPGPRPAPQRPAHAHSGTDRVLDLYRIHNRERLRIAYVRDGEYLPEALGWIDRICRDNLQNEATRMDVVLIDHIWTIKDAFAPDAVIDIVSAYRTPKTNARLRKKSKNVAKKSLHMQGRAIDIRIRGVQADIVARVAESLMLGGVGYYERSGFVHIDTGRPRRWNIY